MSYFSSDSSSEDPSLLVIALDTNPLQNIYLNKPENLTTVLNSICAFGNAHLMQKASNKLAVVSCHHHTSKFLFPSTENHLDIRQFDGQYEKFTLVEKSIKTNLAELIKSAPKVVNGAESMIAGSLSMILCYIFRVRKKFF